MPMAAAAESQIRDCVLMRKESPMNASAAVNEQGDKGSGLQSWRILVFGGIGTLYLVSLFVPALRETLARVFAYFPQ